MPLIERGVSPSLSLKSCMLCYAFRLHIIGFFLYNLPEKNKLRQFGGRFRKRRTNILLTHLWV